MQKYYHVLRGCDGELGKSFPQATRMTKEMTIFPIYFNLLLILQYIFFQICEIVSNAIFPSSLDSLSISQLCLTSVTYSETQMTLHTFLNWEIVGREEQARNINFFLFLIIYFLPAVSFLLCVFCFSCTEGQESFRPS